MNYSKIKSWNYGSVFLTGCVACCQSFRTVCPITIITPLFIRSSQIGLLLCASDCEQEWGCIQEPMSLNTPRVCARIAVHRAQS